MSNSFNSVQLPSKIGSDFNSQYAVPDTNLTEKTTLQNNPLYNLAKVLFQGKQTDNISRNPNGLMLDDGLKANPDKGNHKLFLQA
jgi:hypothetical protein